MCPSLTNYKLETVVIQGNRKSGYCSAIVSGISGYCHSPAVMLFSLTEYFWNRDSVLAVLGYLEVRYSTYSVVLQLFNCISRGKVSLIYIELSWWTLNSSKNTVFVAVKQFVLFYTLTFECIWFN